MPSTMKNTALSLMLSAVLLGLTACGGGDAPAADTNGADAGGTATGSPVAGCSGDVANLFDLAKGSYTATVATFDTIVPAFASPPATVAGFANGSVQTVTVKTDCTIVVGGVTLSYKNGSYLELPGTGADAGKIQYDVDLSGTGVHAPRFERFTNGKRGLSFFDPVNTFQRAQLDE
jgi:ABC-type phosphate transport system substrate-binding protein